MCWPTLLVDSVDAVVIDPPYQERMPVIIERADWKVWLGEEEGDVTAPLRRLATDWLRVWPVERKVNNVRNNGPELLEPHSLVIEEPVFL
jgi:putative SOS response-associated peptidase YedK